MDVEAAQLHTIRELFELAETRGIPLWLGNGWAIDARLGTITRPHEDVDIAFPEALRAEYLALVEDLGFGRHQVQDYGFLSWRGTVCLDSEPCFGAEGQYSFEGFPPRSCPWGKEGTVQGVPIRCVSWEAIYFEVLGYVRDIPTEQWRAKDFESLRIVEANLPDSVKRGLRHLHSGLAPE